MLKTVLVAGCATLALSLGAIVPVGPQPASSGMASFTPSFICRLWPSAPGCRW